MTNKKLSLILSCGLLLLSATACKKETPPASESAPMANAPVTQSAVESPTPAEVAITAAAPTQFTTVLSGKLDNALGVQMSLIRQGNKLSGSYFYERVGAANLAEKTLSLAGKIEKDGQVSLAETAIAGDGSEQKTGEFKGAIDSVTVNGETRLRFLGTWTSAKNKKSVPFALEERHFDLGGFKLTEKPLQEKNKKLRMEVEAILPQLTGGDPATAEKFNKAVAAFLNKHIAAFKTEATTLRKDEEAANKEAAAEAAAEAAKEAATTAKAAEPAAKPEAQKDAEPEMPPYSFDGGFELVYATPDFISLLLEYSTYYGGAHPGHQSVSFNFDLKRGVEVKLADLFAPKSNYLKLISGYAVKELKKLSTTSDVEMGAGPKLENWKSWNVTPLGLQFTLDPYQVGAYAVGAHEVIVPYDVLKPAIKSDGPLAAFLQ